MVLDCSEIARVIAWRIHQVAYVENLFPNLQLYFSIAFIKPEIPS